MFSGGIYTVTVDLRQQAVGMSRYCSVAKRYNVHTNTSSASFYQPIILGEFMRNEGGMSCLDDKPLTV